MDAPAIPWIDPDFQKNRDGFPIEELWKHIGKHIAWSWDGTRIVAVGDTLEEVDRQVDKLGVDRSKVVHDYVDDPDVSYL
jgi:hypothetical protein